MIDPNYLQQEILKINDKYPNINYGGCGTFSYHLHKTLKDKYNIDTEICYMPGPRCAIEYDIKFTHILLKWEGLLIDNTGFYLSSEHQDLESLSPDKLEEMINIPQLWNNVFDMSTKDELIKEIWSI
jgi:hypothetical protein